MIIIYNETDSQLILLYREYLSNESKARKGKSR